MRVLSPADHEFFAHNGYVVVPNAVPQANLDALVAAVWAFLGMDPNDPDDWYRPPMLTNGLVEMYQHQAMWDNRQYPRVHQAFSEILGTHKLWVSFDRIGLKVPARADHPEYDHKGFTHWDIDTTNPPKQRRVQGVLVLTDTAPNQGGFQCVPELYRDFPEWVKRQPADRDPRHPDLTGYKVTPIPGKAGDLIIWDVMLAHGNGHNVSDKPRLAQYITMSPAREDDADARARRIHQWQHRVPPGGGFPGDVRRIEEAHGVTAQLTPLGRKLLGLDRWDEAAAAAG